MKKGDKLLKEKNPLTNKAIVIDDFPLATALQLHIEKHLSFAQVAKIIGHPKSTTHRKIANFLKYLKAPQTDLNNQLYDEHITKLKKNRAVEMLILMGDKEKQKSATLGNLGYVLGQLDQSIRLDQGQPTSNIQILIADLDKLKPRFEAMERIYRERKEIEEKASEQGIDE
jgi:hypothetical protein